MIPCIHQRPRPHCIARIWMRLLFPRKQWRGLGKLARSPVLSPTSERFMRSIASRGGNGLEWINGSRNVVETCKHLRLRSRRMPAIFFSPPRSVPFFTGSVRFVRPAASLGGAVVLFPQPSSCTARATVQRCGSDPPDEENTATRCERACKTIRIFSTWTRCNPQNGVAYVVSEFIPADFFRKQYCAVEHSAKAWNMYDIMGEGKK